MRVLWISNVAFPQLCRRLGILIPYVGGWMESAAKALLNFNSSIELGVVSFWRSNRMEVVDEGRIKYYLIPEQANKKCYDKRVESYYRQVEMDFTPDIVHIHGSEYGHSLAWVRACGTDNVVVSIQGLVHSYANYFFGGIERSVIRYNITLRDIIRCDSLLQQQRKMKIRGVLEIELLSRIKHVIGRTSWDRSCVWAINPSAHYYYCNETLRDPFYKEQWQYEHCEPYSIFLSQAHYPIKGLQQIIKALPLVFRQYPNTKVYIAGNNFCKKAFFRKNGFAKYIEKLVKELNTNKNLIFLGVLSAEQMAEQYRKANVFICPSAIENSPNSVGEAQLIGTPVISSYVGGAMDMVEDGKTGFLYRFEEIPLLAMRICQLFSDVNLCKQLSENERIVANNRHNKVTNAQSLLNIYERIVS